jgi:hypothetical protein
LLIDIYPKLKSETTLPYWDFSSNHVFHLLVIRTANRTEFQDYLLSNQIETVILHPIPPHKQSYFLIGIVCPSYNRKKKKIHDSFKFANFSPTIDKKKKKQAPLSKQ